MKKLMMLVCAMSVAVMAMAQEKNEFNYEFTDVKKIEAATPVKNQASSGTCWAFSSISFLENELLKAGKGEHDLSEMWIVRWAYYEKAIKYVRMHGTINFSQGGATEDVFAMWEKYGIVPEEVYTGLQYGSKTHRHGELEAAMKAYVSSIIDNRQLSTKWLEGLNGILDAYFGEIPETFTWEGVEYTPKSYAEHLGLNMDDYVSFTSYTHHPFYTWFPVEVPDNWMWAESFNLPIDELISVIDNAIEGGYSIAWGADVSEQGFIRKNGQGYAIIPPFYKEDKSDTEEARWVELSAAERAMTISNLTAPVKPTEITQEMRQKAFDNYETTDDHGMCIEGLAKDQDGNKFYRVKNSWDVTYGYDGYLYVSEPFMKYKTMNIAVNKKALPKAIKAKMGIK